MTIQTVDEQHRDRRDREDQVQGRLAVDRFPRLPAWSSVLWDRIRERGRQSAVAGGVAGHRTIDLDIEEVLGDRHQVFQVDRPAEHHLDRQAGHEQQQHRQRRGTGACPACSTYFLKNNRYIR